MQENNKTPRYFVYLAYVILLCVIPIRSSSETPQVEDIIHSFVKYRNKMLNTSMEFDGKLDHYRSLTNKNSEIFYSGICAFDGERWSLRQRS